MEIIVRLSKSELANYGGVSKRLEAFVYDLLERREGIHPLPTGQRDLTGVHVSIQLTDLHDHH